MTDRHQAMQDRETIRRIMEVLADIRAPDGRNLVQAGYVAHIRAETARVILSTTPAEARLLASPASEAEAALKKAGFAEAQVIITTERAAEPPPAAAPAQTQPNQAPPNQEKLVLPCRFIVAVASGKGGVGKSTFAANLAVAAAKRGLATGLLDADIYGPSQPQMFGITDKPGLNAEKKMLPVEAHGVGVLSIGMMLSPEKAVIWRGLMVQSAITQLLGDSDWGKKDLLVIDMPPGTGDAPITLAQRLNIDGALIVTTPQEIALADVRRAMAMFQRMQVPLLGLAENMAWLEQNGVKVPVFGQGGGERLATQTHIPFLGALPLEPEIGLMSEAGTPITAAQPNHAAAQFFDQLAEKLYARLEEGARKNSTN